MPDSALWQALRAAWSSAPPDPAHDIAHVQRVLANAKAIAKADPRPINPTVLHAAAILHDLIALPKDAPNRAEASSLSAEAAAPILRAEGYSPADIASTRHAIAAHSFSARIPSQTPEAEILQDADRLDALGAIGLARTFMVAGSLQCPLYEPQDPFAERRAPNDTAFALDHFKTKLLRLHETMNTKAGRAIAQSRTALMQSYLNDLRAEISAQSCSTEARSS